MSEIEVANLLSNLPTVTPPLLVKPPEGFRYESISDPLFVAPPLEVVQPLEAGKTAVVLVEAAASVGKSMLAREVAVRTKAPFWDLAGEPVSGGAFVGGLSWSFGHAGSAGGRIDVVMNGLESGSFLVVLDGLDETRVASKTPLFEAFLAEISTLPHASRTKPTVLMFGRKESVDLACYHLAVNDVPYGHFQIGYFTEPGAMRFISSQLEDLYRRNGQQAQHKTQLFREALKGFFGLIYDLLQSKGGGKEDPWQNPTTRSVLGYAPVLQAVAKYFFDEGPNWHAVEQGLRKVKVQRGWAGVWQLFAEILDRILLREQREKTLPLLRIRLGSVAKAEGWDKWDKLYTPEEQRQRILALDPLRIPHGDLPAKADLPDALRTDYQKAIVHERLPDHPFRRENRRLDDFGNVVFRDDTYAWLLGSTSVAQEQKRKLRARLRDPGFPHSPVFYSSLYARLSQGGDDPVIDEEDIGLVYDSVRSELGSSSGSGAATEDVRLEVHEDGNGDLWVTFLPKKGGERLGRFRAKGGGEGLTFVERLSNAKLTVPNTNVTFGVEGAEFVLGPYLDVDCRHLRIAADDVRFNAGQEDKAVEDRLVALRAGQCDAGDARLAIAQGDKRFLQVDWGSTKVEYPWAEFSRGLRDTGTIDAQGEFDRDVLRALEVLARRAYGFLDLTSVTVRNDFPQPVLDLLWKCNILKKRETPIRGKAENKPELDGDVVRALTEHATEVAQGRIPTWVYERLKTGL